MLNFLGDFIPLSPMQASVRENHNLSIGAQNETQLFVDSHFSSLCHDSSVDLMGLGQALDLELQPRSGPIAYPQPKMLPTLET